MQFRLSFLALAISSALLVGCNVAGNNPPASDNPSASDNTNTANDQNQTTNDQNQNTYDATALAEVKSLVGAFDHYINTLDQIPPKLKEGLQNASEAANNFINQKATERTLDALGFTSMVLEKVADPSYADATLDASAILALVDLNYFGNNISLDSNATLSKSNGVLTLSNFVVTVSDPNTNESTQTTISLDPINLPSNQAASSFSLSLQNLTAESPAALVSAPSVQLNLSLSEAIDPQTATDHKITALESKTLAVTLGSETDPVTFRVLNTNNANESVTFRGSLGLTTGQNAVTQVKGFNLRNTWFQKLALKGEITRYDAQGKAIESVAAWFDLAFPNADEFNLFYEGPTAEQATEIENILNNLPAIDLVRAASGTPSYINGNTNYSQYFSGNYNLYQFSGNDNYYLILPYQDAFGTTKYAYIVGNYHFPGDINQYHFENFGYDNHYGFPDETSAYDALVAAHNGQTPSTQHLNIFGDFWVSEDVSAYDFTLSNTTIYEALGDNWGDYRGYAITTYTDGSTTAYAILTKNDWDDSFSPYRLGFATEAAAQTALVDIINQHLTEGSGFNLWLETSPININGSSASNIDNLHYEGNNFWAEIQGDFALAQTTIDALPTVGNSISTNLNISWIDRISVKNPEEGRAFGVNITSDHVPVYALTAGTKITGLTDTGGNPVPDLSLTLDLGMDENHPDNAVDLVFDYGGQAMKLHIKEGAKVLIDKNWDVKAFKKNLQDFIFINGDAQLIFRGDFFNFDKFNDNQSVYKIADLFYNGQSYGTLTMDFKQGLATVDYIDGSQDTFQFNPLGGESASNSSM